MRRQKFKFLKIIVQKWPIQILKIRKNGASDKKDKIKSFKDYLFKFDFLPHFMSGTVNDSN